MATAHLICSCVNKAKADGYDILLDACKRDAELANAAISSTPTGEYRDRLTEINILRLQAITEARVLREN